MVPLFNSFDDQCVQYRNNQKWNKSINKKCHHSCHPCLLSTTSDFNNLDNVWRMIKHQNKAILFCSLRNSNVMDFALSYKLSKNSLCDSEVWRNQEKSSVKSIRILRNKAVPAIPSQAKIPGSALIPTILYDVYAIQHRKAAGIILRFADLGVIHSIRFRGQTIPIHL